jgi:hypothetical protein
VLLYLRRLCLYVTYLYFLSYMITHTAFRQLGLGPRLHSTRLFYSPYLVCVWSKICLVRVFFYLLLVQTPKPLRTLTIDCYSQLVNRGILSHALDLLAVQIAISTLLIPNSQVMLCAASLKPLPKEKAVIELVVWWHWIWNTIRYCMQILPNSLLFSIHHDSLLT